MATVEIDENELAGLRGIATTMDGLLKSPKTRRKVLESVKLVHPEAVIPEIDAATPYVEQLDGLNKKVDEFIEAQNKTVTEREEKEKLSALEREFAEGKSALKAQGYSAEAIEKIESLMEKEGIRSHLAAAAYFDRLNPQPTAISSSNRFINPVLDPAARKDDEYLNALYEGDAEGATNGMIDQALRDIRTGY